MKKKPSGPPLPPLSLEALEKVDTVERYVKQRILECHDGLRFKAETAARLFRSCALGSFQIQLADYTKREDFSLVWLSEMQAKTVSLLLDLLPVYQFDAEQRNELALQMNSAIQDFMTSLDIGKKPAPSESPSQLPNAEATRRGYRKEIHRWMTRVHLENLDQASKRLGLSKSALKSIMSDKGTARYGPKTLERILEIIGYDEG